MKLARRLKTAIKALHNDTAGAMSVEKIMIIALIALPILLLLLAFRKTIVGWFQNEANQLQP